MMRSRLTMAVLLLVLTTFACDTQVTVTPNMLPTTTEIPTVTSSPTQRTQRDTLTPSIIEVTTCPHGICEIGTPINFKSPTPVTTLGAVTPIEVTPLGGSTP
jgi:hypothetical protein